MNVNIAHHYTPMAYYKQGRLQIDEGYLAIPFIKGVSDHYQEKQFFLEARMSAEDFSGSPARPRLIGQVRLVYRS